MARTTREAREIEALLSVVEVADLLGVVPLTVHRLVRRGELQPVKVGTRTLFEPVSVREFIEAHRRTPGAAA